MISMNLLIKLLHEKLCCDMLHVPLQLLPEWEAEQIAWITISARTAEHYTNSLDMLVAYRGL